MLGKQRAHDEVQNSDKYNYVIGYHLGLSQSKSQVSPLRTEPPLKSFSKVLAWLDSFSLAAVCCYDILYIRHPKRPALPPSPRPSDRLQLCARKAQRQAVLLHRQAHQRTVAAQLLCGKVQGFGVLPECFEDDTYDVGFVG